MKLIAAVLCLVSLSCPLGAAPRATAVAQAKVVVKPGEEVGVLSETIFGTNITTGDRARMSNPDFVSLVKTMGIKSCRFPNGCEADRYNWKSPGAGQATVDEFLEFCDRIGAEAYYTVNMQGGTEGLTGPVPDNAVLDERVKYRHTAPNPCGDTNYHYGTLSETLELVQKYTIDRALAGQRPIVAYEMGNENWGQAFTDWPPEVYARTVELYARAMRKLVADAAAAHEKLKNLKLYIVAVGFPVMGNNTKLVDTPDRRTNTAWTSALNRLHDDGVIDAVQEHYYPYGSANGGTIAWAAHNLHNIILVRKGVPNARLGGYKDPELAYNMPMEHTEWNVKCWGGRFKEDVQFANGDFAADLGGWTLKGGAELSSGSARRGEFGCLLKSDKDSTTKVAQVFPKPPGAVSVVAGVWIRTKAPQSVKVCLKQANAGEHAEQMLGSFSPSRSGMWERVMAGGKCFADTELIEFSIEVDGPAEVDVDEAKVYYTTEERGQAAISATTYEQQLFFVDAIREMLAGGCPRSHFHHLCGDYPCGAATGKGELKDLGKVFQFFNGAYGNRVVASHCESDRFAYYSSGNSYATDFNALAPNRDDIQSLACLASKKGRDLYLLLINRTTDREIAAEVDLGAEPSNPNAALRVLSGNDIDLPGAVLSEAEVKVARRFVHRIGPLSAEILSVAM